MTRFFIITLIIGSWLHGPATPVVAQTDLAVIDPAPGRAAAVVVADSLPLIHTAQFLAYQNDLLGGKFEELRRVLRDAGSSLDRVVKLNFVVADNATKAVVEKFLTQQFKDKHRPAISFVTGKLPLNASIGFDAVAAGTRRAAWKRVETGEAYAILPPGTRIYVSGQAVAGKTIAEATRKTLEELRDTLKFLGLKDSSIVQLKAFFNPVDQVDQVQKEFERFFGDTPVPPPYVLVEWKSSLPIEIELIAWGGPLRYGIPIEYLTPPGMKASPVYSRVARINDGKLIYLSSLWGDKDDNPAEEIPSIFEQMGKVLEKAGSDYRHLAKATYYVTNAEAVKKMGEIRPKYYDPKRPPAASLAVVQGTGIASKRVTMDMIAVPSPRLKVNEYGPAERGQDLRAMILPAEFKALLAENDLTGWKAINHPSLPKERQPTWTIKDGVVTCVGGPGCLEYQDKQFTNFVLQLEVRTKLRHTNGGVFFRSMPGSFMNGYEAQIYNRCHDGDVSKPWTWATGAIDDRQNTRRLVSRDGEWFHYTIIAQGDRIATWVNGYQTAEFKDERPEHENPRLGKRTKAGTIQLQAHDIGTEIEFRNIRIAEWK